MTRNGIVLGLLIACAWFLLVGPWELGAFLGWSETLVALIAPDDEHVDAWERNHR